MSPFRLSAELPWTIESAARGFLPTGGFAIAWMSTSEPENPRQPPPSPMTTAVESYHVRGATISSIPGHGRPALGSTPSRSATPPAIKPR